jgi:hypothetical protein
MQSKTLFLATALAMFPAGAALAQTSATATPENATPAAAPDASAADASVPGASAAGASADAATQAAPGADASSDAAATAAATQADLKTGATVYDSTGATVGTIQSVTANGAVVASGKLRAEVPAASFAKNSRGLVIGITKAEFEAAVNRAKS